MKNLLFNNFNHFEWDENKRQSNIEKHGIDFEEVKLSFYSKMLIKRDDRQNYGENRYIALGVLTEFIITIIFTQRANNLRIISSRKSNRNERKSYRDFLNK